MHTTLGPFEEQRDIKERPVDIHFLALDESKHHELKNRLQEYSHSFKSECRKNVPPNVNFINQLHPDLKFNTYNIFQNLCTEERAPNFVTSVNQCMPYQRSYRLTTTLHDIKRQNVCITLGCEGENSVQVTTIGRAIIIASLLAK